MKREKSDLTNGVGWKGRGAAPRFYAARRRRPWTPWFRKTAGVMDMGNFGIPRLIDPSDKSSSGMGEQFALAVGDNGPTQEFRCIAQNVISRSSHG
jgi:hypothetical protein